MNKIPSGNRASHCSETRSAARWLATGFFALGASIGFACGLSSASVTLPLLAALFALIGGSLVSFIGKLRLEDRATAGQALVAFSAGFILSLSAGIAVKVNRFMDVTPAARTDVSEPYLKSSPSSYADKLEALCRNKQYDALRQAATDGARK
ncbi:hypothetical protein [Paraburkholderia dilworthii]|uniref:hypothetical protein n=1 Tax=Paraburkholderia dilworthii TaxID=948106 RepID=UPI0012693D05|nr:hypothetical protein [Paraburkholderia dilworthii]